MFLVFILGLGTDSLNVDRQAELRSHILYMFVVNISQGSSWRSLK